MKNTLRNILLLFVSLCVEVGAISAATPPAGADDGDVQFAVEIPASQERRRTSAL